MYSSFHKISVIIIVIVWSIYQFQSQTKNTGDVNYVSGISKRTGVIKNNKNEGEWIWYYANGKIQLKGSFRNGQREGVWKTYDSSGNLSIESNYVENKLNGIQTHFSSMGKVIKKIQFRNDQIIE
jgi:antitoxin component YwqK of YwqJK toxin-antitoxin module